MTAEAERTRGHDPRTALRLGIAAEHLDPGDQTRPAS
jgi:hypothetical protein